MAKVSRFVRPEVVRLPLSGEDWIEVKRELTVGEQRAAMARTVKTMRSDGRFEPDLAMIGKSEVVAYLVDWSFTGDDDKPVKCSADAIDSLTVDTYDEIEKAIHAHIKRVEDERKNAMSGTSSS